MSSSTCLLVSASMSPSTLSRLCRSPCGWTPLSMSTCLCPSSCGKETRNESPNPTWYMRTRSWFFCSSAISHPPVNEREVDARAMVPALRLHQAGLVERHVQVEVVPALRHRLVAHRAVDEVADGAVSVEEHRAPAQGLAAVLDELGGDADGEL